MSDLGQSDIKSHKSMSLSGVFQKAGEVCSLGGLYLAPVCLSGPLPALIIFQTQFNLFLSKNFATNCLVRRQKYINSPLQKQEKVQHNDSLTHIETI